MKQIYCTSISSDCMAKEFIYSIIILAWLQSLMASNPINGIVLPSSYKMGSTSIETLDREILNTHRDSYICTNEYKDCIKHAFV